MSRVETLTSELEQAFGFILRERMDGIPILNSKLDVEAVDFCEREGRPFGVLVTPWLMNLVLLPGEGEDWSQMKTGESVTHDFPAGPRAFQANEIEGFGVVQTFALYSPMFRFVNQDHARAAARHSLKELMCAPDPETHLDEERLKQFIEEGKMPLADAAGDGGGGAETGAENTTEIPHTATAAKPAPQIARSDLLRGRFGGN